MSISFSSDSTSKAMKKCLTSGSKNVDLFVIAGLIPSGKLLKLKKLDFGATYIWLSSEEFAAADVNGSSAPKDNSNKS